MSPRIVHCLAIAALCAATFRPALAGAQAATGNTRPRSDTSANPTTVAPSGVVNINTATADELERIPGIGPSRAAAIVALRSRVQHFHGVDDLLRVRGIGRTGLHRMRGYMTLSGTTTLTIRPGRTAAAHASAPAEGGAR